MSIASCNALHRAECTTRALRAVVLSDLDFPKRPNMSETYIGSLLANSGKPDPSDRVHLAFTAVSAGRELAVGGKRARSVHRCRATVHEDRDSNQFGDFLIGRPGASGTFCMRGDATIASGCDRDCKRNEFLGLGIEGPGLESGGVESAETLVDVGNQFAKVARNGREGSLDIFAIGMNVVMGFVVRHALSQPQRRVPF